MKTCSKCKIPKDIDEFGLCKIYPDGHTYDCRECHNKSRSDWAEGQ